MYNERIVKSKYKKTNKFQKTIRNKDISLIRVKTRTKASYSGKIKKKASYTGKNEKRPLIRVKTRRKASYSGEKASYSGLYMNVSKTSLVITSDNW